MLYATLSEELNDLGRSLSCESIIQVEKWPITITQFGAVLQDPQKVRVLGMEFIWKPKYVLIFNT